MVCDEVQGMGPATPNDIMMWDPTNERQVDVMYYDSGIWPVTGVGFVVRRFTREGEADPSLPRGRDRYDFGVVAACPTEEARDAALRLLRMGTCLECGNRGKVYEGCVASRGSCDEGPIYRPCSRCSKEGLRP